MKQITILLLCLSVMFCACRTKIGGFENEILRMNTSENHASIQRAEMTGNNLTLSGKQGLPEWFIGKAAFTEFFLPKMVCTTFYDEETGDKKTHMTCEEMPEISVEAKADAKGGYVGDIIATGEAAGLASGYEASVDSTNMWIEAMKQAVLTAEIDSAEREKRLDSLTEIGKFLGTILTQ